jgi:drug/metabolite transporter (DMT)-like permease
VGKRLPLPQGAMRTATQMLCGGGLMALASVALGERVPGAVSGRAIGAVAYLAVLGSLVGFSAYNYLLHHTRTAVATSYAYVNPVIALVLGVAFAGEHIDITGALGAGAILAAVLMITRGKASAPTPPKPNGASEPSETSGALIAK